jgi:hypothetical protein
LAVERVEVGIMVILVAGILVDTVATSRTDLVAHLMSEATDLVLVAGDKVKAVKKRQ